MARVSPSKIEYLEKKRVLDAYFKVDEYRVKHERFDGTMSEPLPLLVFDRHNPEKEVNGDAAAALLFDPDRRNVILVNQFRLPTCEKGSGRGWMLETAAGMLRILGEKEGGRSETPEECIAREVLDETGYQITDLVPVARFFASPGCSTEVIHLFYAEVRSTDRVNPGGGLIEEGEHIEVVPMPEREFFDKMARREFEDPKIIIAGQWLKERRSRTAVETDDKTSKTHRFSVKGAANKTIGIKTGNILAVDDVDVWVNSENTFMMMDRFFAKSISSTIRAAGAKKDQAGRIVEDTVGKALTREMRQRSFVELGVVLDTEAGELATSHDVKRILHVATAEGAINGGLSTGVGALETCVDRVLEYADAMGRRYRSILFPMIGTGQAGLLVSEVAPRLVERAIAYLKSHPRSSLGEIYFLAYSFGDEDVLMDAMRGSRDLEMVGQNSAAHGAQIPVWRKALPRGLPGVGK